MGNKEINKQTITLNTSPDRSSARVYVHVDLVYFPPISSVAFFAVALVLCLHVYTFLHAFLYSAYTLTFTLVTSENKGTVEGRGIC